MRKLLIASLLSLSLAGCATQGNGGGGGGVPSIDPATVQQIKDTAATICGFVPTATTVASIIATFTGGGAVVDMVGQAAQGICAAVTAKGVRRGGPPPKYRGVRIQGKFVR